MKFKYSNIIILIFISILILSCSNSKRKYSSSEESAVPAELEDLFIKYNELEINNCDELFIIGDEMIDVYISTVYRAYDGSERAKSDLLDFDSFVEKFSIEAEKISEECPEEFRSWTKNAEKRIEEVNDKLEELFKPNEYEHIKIDDYILEDLDRQMKELNEDIKKMLENETFIDTTETENPENLEIEDDIL